MTAHRVLQGSNVGRLPELVPIRVGRMLTNPFAFFRGAAGVMAHDLAKTPSTGVYAKGARERVVEHVFPKITAEVGGRPRFADHPPLIFDRLEDDIEQRAREAFGAYRESFPDERRVLLDRYRLEDFVIKVVRIARGRWPAADAVVQRHLSRLGTRPARVDFYGRQLRDMKFSPSLQAFATPQFERYLE
jgi:uncharacterized protein DUF2252